ncbi:MAG: multidrug ABC transporter [Oscillospiraceae bacterium]|nr:multidrug ABC transporter [Oscillospiraceae bacterium]
MTNNMLPYIILYLVNIFIAAVSQVLLKKAALKKYPNFIAEYLNPLVIMAYGLFFGTTLLGVLAYKGIPISLGMVLECTSYLYVTFFGVIIFKEKINRQKIIALFLIITGVLIFTLMPF